MKNYPETYSFVFRAVLNSLQWIMHETECRVNKPLNSWSVAHRWSVCRVSDKGFDRKWTVTWSGNQKSCCSWGHLCCHADRGFYLKALLLQHGSSGWGKCSPDVSKAASHRRQVSLVYPKHFSTQTFWHRIFFLKVSLIVFFGEYYMFYFQISSHFH